MIALLQIKKKKYNSGAVDLEIHDQLQSKNKNNFPSSVVKIMIKIQKKQIDI